jgi:UV DNA damage endonuclease
VTVATHEGSVFSSHLPAPSSRLRWGLCCHFVDAPIKFRAATHRYVATLATKSGRRYLRDIARDNAQALIAAIEHCHDLGIGAFRISSQILPLATHPASGYALDLLDPSGEIETTFRLAGDLARLYDIRLSFHPDQFVVLNSAHEHVAQSSIAELELQGRLAELVEADTIVLHAGGAVGGVAAALDRLRQGLTRLSPAVRSRLALENDDRQFAPADLLPVCREEGVPLVYDVHHHRCHPDALSIEEATELAAETWMGREPWCHLSSPREGWGSPNPRPHADYIDPADFPDAWLGRSMTVDVEAKAKERAVLAVSREVGARSREVEARSQEPGAAFVTYGTASFDPMK